MTVTPDAPPVPASQRSPEHQALLEEAAALHRLGDLGGAADRYCALLQADPRDPDALHLGALVAYQRGCNDVALELVSRSLAIRPGYGPAHGTHALALTATGQRTAALAELRRAVALDPTDQAARANLLFAIDSDPLASCEEGRAARQAYDDALVRPLLPAVRPPVHDPRPDRRLRIGYVSADFRTHSVAGAIWPIIAHHDRSRFEVHLFSDVQTPDAMTERFRASCDQYVPIRGRADEDVAGLILDARIDILVDLGGFARDGRTLVFARQPSPIQVLAWGYVADCYALSCHDVVFADAVTVPPGDEANVPVVRLPAFMPYAPVCEMPAVADPPVARNGYVTYGYLGRPHKLNDTVLAVWAEILHRVPASRLLLKSGQYDNEAYTFAIVDGLVSRGIEDDRIEVRGGTSPYDHAASYADVDVALDPTKQSGGMTTLESTYMGVPTVCLLGDTITTRTSASILTCAFGSRYAEKHLIARTRFQYIRKAVDLAVRLQRRKHVRRDLLRVRFERSPLMAYEPYTRSVEAAYRNLWRAGCAADAP